MAASKREIVQITAYSRRLRDNVKSIMDNYVEILRASKVNHSLSKAVLFYCKTDSPH